MDFDEILVDAKEREITKEEALFLFDGANDRVKISQLLRTASYVRDENIGELFKLKAFILSSNQGCNIDPPCIYCGQSSDKAKFFTKIATAEEVAESAKIAEEIGFKGVQSGGGCSGNKGSEAVEDTRTIRSVTELDVFVNYGADMSVENIRKLKELGVDSIGCSLETINEEVFKKIKPGGSLDERKSVAQMIDKHGVGLTSGMMINTGESHQDRVDHIFYLKNFANLKLVYISGFSPIPGTPMENRHPATSFDIAKTMAIVRLVHRDIDLDGSFGRDDQLQLWIMAGANHRLIHGIFEPKNKMSPHKFRGEVQDIGENYVFMNILPIYVNMIEETGLKADLTCA